MNKNDIKEAGLKITQPRVQILKILETSKEKHFSAEDLYQLLREEDSKIGLATIYRVLTQFETAGLVIRHNFEGGQAVFELDKGEHHDHIVDMKNGKIIEFHDEIIEQRQIEIAKEHGYKLLDHSLILYAEPE
ncbi:ferric iron uptake transcriptional regulator [Cocleimonas flava]|jgi:Fur family ferric uptake transcriptional regulator|uniref:Ferric uptake regulation protein n=2 Tax=Cocleimonas flava TaxID=634765 RepID=A0A4R1F147_9GAMM|nr:ferric iron uptake transcriptional regulator [Cocleimonas flava]MEB8433571.1 ferric iron uptake transcriptional regulator [Cocleimonas sp. KMM 6892]MEC4716382.1 ferric iron uptake transcriptional regulator [Cocleimonas sp. KMM 6895]MEC4745725.1 ferric iron uptake transcriptional regulator [Cocleimonas sp. KMM 6896]TCJ85218.1 Fur family ferric uptake transcriptional regulator [Cocleimonas flava]